MRVNSLSRVRLLKTPWTAAYQAPPSIGFSRQEYWSGLPLPSPWGNIRLKEMLIKLILPASFPSYVLATRTIGKLPCSDIRLLHSPDLAHEPREARVL